MLGALLCVLAALLTVSAYARANRPPTTQYVVASVDLEPGAALEPDDLQLVTMRLPAPIRSRAIERPGDLDGATVLGPVAKGELVQIGNVIKKAGGAESEEVSFPIDVAYAAGGRIRSGERADVIATFGSGEGAQAEVVAADAFVSHVDRSGAGLGSNGDALVVTIVADGSFDPNRLAEAIASAKLMLVRTTGSPGRTPASTGTPTAEPTPSTMAAPTAGAGS